MVQGLWEVFITDCFSCLQLLNACSACRTGDLTSQTDSFIGKTVCVYIKLQHVCYHGNSYFPLLCSIGKTWENVNTDHADVKEVSLHHYYIIRLITSLLHHKADYIIITS